MNIIEQINIEVLKSKLDTPIEELDLSVRTYNCLKGAGIKTIHNMMNLIKKDQFGRIKDLGKKGFNEIRKKILEYGIDLTDRGQCEELINKYKYNGKQKQNIDIVDLLDMTIEDFDLSIKTYNCLKRARINLGYDVLKNSDCLERIRNLGKKSFNELKEKFQEYGIDLTDRIQCKEAIKEYNKQTNGKKEKKAEEWEQQLELEESNDRLEDKLELKQEILRGLKQQLERREYLNKKISECDKEFERLMKSYQALNSKESSNNHGTK